MRTRQLLSIAAQAEKIRLQRCIVSLVERVVLTIAAAVFIVCALVFGEYAGFRALADHLPLSESALITSTVNLAIAVLFLVLAAWKRRDRVKAEAKLVRNNAVRELQGSLSFAVLVKRLASSMGMNSMSAMALASLAAKFLGRFRMAFVAAVVGAGVAASPIGAPAGHAAVIAAPPPVPAVAPKTNQTPQIDKQAQPPIPAEQVKKPAVKNTTKVE